MSLGAVFPYSVSSLKERVWKITDRTQEVVKKSAEIGQKAASKLGYEAEAKFDKVGGFILQQYDKSTRGDFSHLDRRKSTLELVRISAAVCGIEFCYAAETAFVSPILLKIGVPVLYMTLIWCLSPLFGFFLVPFLGSCSDRCRSKLGRRRPFILMLSLGIIVGLILVPNGENIGILLGDDNRESTGYHMNLTNVASPRLQSRSQDTTTIAVIEDLEPFEPLQLDHNSSNAIAANSTGFKSSINDHKLGIIFTVLGVIMLDFDSDANQSPCRAYLLDITLPEDHSVGLSTFTIMAGLGGSLGYVMGGINWENTKLGEALGGHVRAVFTIVLLIYLVCITLTITSFKEIPLDQLGLGAEVFQKTSKTKGKAKYKKFTNEESESDVADGPDSQDQTCNFQEREPSQLSLQPSEDFETKLDKTVEAGDSDKIIDRADYITLHETETAQEIKEIQEAVNIKTYLKSIVFMPKSLQILCLTNLFCWMSLVCYSLYFTDFVGQAVYGGDPTAPKSSESHQIYEHGVRAGCWGMALYSISCSLYSFVIEKLIRRYGKFNGNVSKRSVTSC